MMNQQQIDILDAEYAEKLNAIERGDVEIAHVYADNLLCDLLTRLGFRRTVKTFEETPRWYS